MILLRSFILFFFIEPLFSKTPSSKSSPIVETVNGKVQGTIETGITGEKFMAFKGIPYAKPPVGPLRFEDPVPPDSWKNVREANKYGESCTQIYVTDSQHGTGEDCLYANVYVRGTHIPKSKFPVIVWIYGGGFMFGEGDDGKYGPDYLMRKNIILITFNYRVGVMGFLNLEDETAPGNVGLQDMVMVLKWVKSNIAKFGGDPGNVSLMGEDAGGMGVHLLALSATAKGLFHKAGIQSGNIFNPLLTIVNPKNFAYELCKALGNETENSTVAKEFLKTVDATKLIEKQQTLYVQKNNVSVIFPFGVSVDAEAKNPILKDDIDDAALNGIQVPLLIGYNSNEAIGIFNKLGNTEQELKEHVNNFMTPGFYSYIEDSYQINTSTIQKMYFNGGNITLKHKINVAKLFSDVIIAQGNLKTIRQQLKTSNKPTYFYIYSYDKTQSAIKKFSAINAKGAGHLDELEMLFREKIFEGLGRPALKKNSERYKIMEMMTEMWTNFARTGDPTPTTSKLLPVKWLPVDDKSNIRYLNISETLKMESSHNLVDWYTLNATA